MGASDRFDSDSLSAGYAEFIVEKKKDGKDFLKKSAIILVGIILIAIVLYFTLSTIPPASFIFAVIFVFLTWYALTFTNKEFEYVIVQGEIDIDVIYGKKSRKRILEVKTAKIEKIAPIEKIREYIKNMQIDKETYACTSPEDSGVYGVLYTDENNKNCVFYINLIKKTADCFKYYKRSALETDGEF